MNMNIVIKTQGTMAIYEQIVNQMKNQIVTGVLQAGEALPSIRALAGELQVSVITTKEHTRNWKRKDLFVLLRARAFMCANIIRTI